MGENLLKAFFYRAHLIVIIINYETVVLNINRKSVMSTSVWYY